MKLEIDNCYNMDCLDGMRLMKEQGIKADMLLTDIPYAVVNREGGIRNMDKGKADIKTFALEDFLPLTDEVVSGSFIIFCSTEQVSEIRKFYVNLGYTTRLLIWEKTNPSPMAGEFVYLSGIECAVYAKKNGATFNANCKNTVFRYPIEKSDIHDTPKPLRLWYELLQDNTNENQLVLDTCMGSWTTAVACHKLQRHFIGFELDKDYYYKGKGRYDTLTAQLSIFDL